jgi:DNA-binding transcriptional LysR family regulator
MGDVNGYLILPHVMGALEKRAPHVSLTTRHLPPDDTLEALDADELDFAISTGFSPPKSIRSVSLLADEMVCVMRKGHPALKKPLTTKGFLALRHIKIAQSIVDEDIARQHLERDVVLNIPHWLVALSVVESTDLVTSLSRRMASLFNTRGQFELRPLPVGHERFHWCMYWHRRYDEHPAHRWMRDLITEVCGNIAAPE